MLTTLSLVSSHEPSQAVDVSDHLGELSQALLDIIREEYRLVLRPEPAAGLIDTLTRATGGLMLRAAWGLIGSSLEAEVDEHFSTLMRCLD